VSGQAQVTITNGADQTMEKACETGDWQRVELRFVAQHNRAVLRVAATDPRADSTFFIDNASVRELPQ